MDANNKSELCTHMAVLTPKGSISLNVVAHVYNDINEETEAGGQRGQGHRGSCSRIPLKKPSNKWSLLTLSFGQAWLVTWYETKGRRSDTYLS
jgi:hypothetical protein